jgi:cytochrome b subunit of formate dehydrogenase
MNKYSEREKKKGLPCLLIFFMYHWMVRPILGIAIGILVMGLLDNYCHHPMIHKKDQQAWQNVSGIISSDNNPNKIPPHNAYKRCIFSSMSWRVVT